MAKPTRLFDKAMHYRCQNGHHERLMYLERGLETGGDDHLPVPFIAGKCRECGGWVEHVDWHRDEQYDPPLTEIPDDAPYFQYPGKRKRKQMGEQACGIPMNRPQEWMGPK